MAAALIWCPFARREEAEVCARQLLDEDLVACANIFPPMHSLFAWKGEISVASEVGVLFKTSDRQLSQAVARIDALHPYDQPAVIGWKADAASAGTLEWLQALGGGQS